MKSCAGLVGSDEPLPPHLQNLAVRDADRFNLVPRHLAEKNRNAAQSVGCGHHHCSRAADNHVSRLI